MPQAKPTNPFYLVLLVVGTVFAITACAYGVMTVRGLDPRLADEEGLMGLMSQHGLVILVAELVLLGALTVAAIATDGYWEGEQRSGVRGPRSEVGDREQTAVGNALHGVPTMGGVALKGQAREGETPAEPMTAGDRR